MALGLCELLAKQLTQTELIWMQVSKFLEMARLRSLIKASWELSRSSITGNLQLGWSKMAADC